MSMISRAHTAQSDAEVLEVLGQIRDSAACTGLLHESIQKDNAGDYTRPWFAWINGYFAGLILDLADSRPQLIFKQ